MPTLTLLERQPGVVLTTAHQPVALVITPVVGQNQLSITWSKTSVSTATELIVIRYRATPTDGAGYVSVNWGDGTPVDLHPLGWSVDLELQHSYTSSGSKTITVTINYTDPNIIDENTTLGVTVATSSNLIVDQIQIEKYEDGVLIYEPDWLSISQLATTYTDDRVLKAHSYRYRYRLRKLDQLRQPLVTSTFSTVTSRPAWS